MSGLAHGVVSSAASSAPGIAARAWCDEREIFVELTDGRLVRHPLPDFVLATPLDRRGSCEVEDFGTALWWPQLDEGVGLNWMFGVREDVIEELAGFENVAPEDEPDR